ncbi:MAG: large conductance mechanosensitive channel protein MscL [Nitriliruptorales bacterium]|nr:large conductance mechanosensitive channel protein MscL [Nitriliruptorales bacterium]
MLQEFRDFINKGNVVDLAVAFVLGVAFKPIVDSIVERVLMPAIGVLVGQPNFDTLGTFACENIPPDGPAEGLIVTGGQMCAGSVGAVITAVTSFLLVAGALFFVVRAYNRLQREPEAAPKEADAGPTEIDLLTEIRDALAK